jgi:hypothetical protein
VHRRADRGERRVFLQAETLEKDFEGDLVPDVRELRAVEIGSPSE